MKIEYTESQKNEIRNRMHDLTIISTVLNILAFIGCALLIGCIVLVWLGLSFLGLVIGLIALIPTGFIVLMSIGIGNINRCIKKAKYAVFKTKVNSVKPVLENKNWQEITIEDNIKAYYFLPKDNSPAKPDDDVHVIICLTSPRFAFAYDPIESEDKNPC
jgi:hypothetical protein